MCFSYAEIGATAGDLPPGYRHVREERWLGSGAGCFDRAVERLMTWEMHRRAGLSVRDAAPRVTTGGTAVISFRIGPVRLDAPVGVVEVVDDRRVRGFAYGTLPGHPECGEERFLVHHDRDDGVRATIGAFSRPARWYTILGAPVARRLQDRTTARYLDALADRR